MKAHREIFAGQHADEEFLRNWLISNHLDNYIQKLECMYFGSYVYIFASLVKVRK